MIDNEHGMGFGKDEGGFWGGDFEVVDKKENHTSQCGFLGWARTTPEAQLN